MINNFFSKKFDKAIVTLFFSLFLLVGIFLYKDYSISLDEDINRLNGLVSLKYIFKKIGFILYFEQRFPDIPDINLYPDNIYGVIFDLPLAIIEFFFEFKNIADLFFLRHLIIFIIFFISTIYFFKLIEYHYKKKYLSLLGVVFLITTPRIFSESFYNSKDILFMSLIIMALYYNIRSFSFYNTRDLILGALFTAAASAVRINGAYIIFITLLFHFLDSKKKEFFFKAFILNFFLFFLFLYIFFPYLWENPFYNFYKSFLGFANYGWGGYELYLGEYIRAKFVPWHYFFVWFFITTPIIYLFYIMLGLFVVIKNILTFFLLISVNNKYLLWKNKEQMTNTYLFFVFFIPIYSAIILNSTLYTGWRHLYFVYPILIFISLEGIFFTKRILKKYFIVVNFLLIFLQIFFLLIFLIISHPIQNVYFNSISKNFVINSFPYDYWGLSNLLMINKLISLEYKEKPLNIAAASLMDLNKTKLIMREDQKNKINFLGTEKNKADYIITNFYYNKPFEKKFQVPNNFYSLIKFEIDGFLISEIYKKR